MIIRKTCAFCGKEFETSNGVIKYCSDDCRYRVKNIRAREHNQKGGGKHTFTQHCEICGKEFSSIGVRKKYCSPECKAEGNRRTQRAANARKYVKVEPKKKKCVVCGKEFLAVNSNGRANNKKVCCSAECQRKRYNQEHKKYKDGRHTIKDTKKDLARIQKEARAKGMSYGQYVAIYGR